MTIEEIAVVIERAADAVDRRGYNPLTYVGPCEGDGPTLCEVGAVCEALGRIDWNEGYGSPRYYAPEVAEVLRALHPEVADELDVEGVISSPYRQAAMYGPRTPEENEEPTDVGCPQRGDWREAHEKLARRMRERAAELMGGVEVSAAEPEGRERVET